MTAPEVSAPQARESREWVIQGARPLGGEPTDISIRDGVIAAVGPGVVAPGVQVRVQVDQAGQDDQAVRV